MRITDKMKQRVASDFKEIMDDKGFMGEIREQHAEYIEELVWLELNEEDFPDNADPKNVRHDVMIKAVVPMEVLAEWFFIRYEAEVNDAHQLEDSPHLMYDDAKIGFIHSKFNEIFHIQVKLLETAAEFEERKPINRIFDSAESFAESITFNPSWVSKEEIADYVLADETLTHEMMEKFIEDTGDDSPLWLNIEVQGPTDNDLLTEMIRREVMENDIRDWEGLNIILDDIIPMLHVSGLITVGDVAQASYAVYYSYAEEEYDEL